jgi:UDP-glucuronate decarboxylase
MRFVKAPGSLTGPINLGNPAEITIGDLAEKIIAMTGSKSRLVFGPTPEDDPLRRRPDVSLARHKLGWQPRVDLDDGLRKTIQYFQELLQQDSVLQFSLPPHVQDRASDSSYMAGS